MQKEKEKLTKSKQRVKEYAEVFTPQWLVRDMLDLFPEEMYSDVTKTFLEPACGEGVFLIEILKRKLAYCHDAREGLEALNSLYGIDIQSDNVDITRANLFSIYGEHFPNASEFSILFAMAILRTHIICDNFLDPQTEIVKSWGIEPCKEYVRALERRKKLAEKKKS